MKIAKGLVKRLSYVVPGYVWRQGAFKVNVPDTLARVVKTGGVVMVSSPSMARREYALAYCLSLALRHDYHANIGWLSWYAREADEFTDAVYVAPAKKVMAISIKEDATAFQLDNVRDIVAQANLSFVASSLPALTLAKQLYVPAFCVLTISANDARTETI